MQNKLEMGIITSETLMKKGYSFLIDNIGKTIAAITLFIAALVSFTEISFSHLSGEKFTSTLIMMLIASYVMYFSLEDAGEELGRCSDEYKSAMDRYNLSRNKIKGDDLPMLRGFCLKYTDDELEYRRKSLIFSLGYTEEEYNRYLRGEISSKETAKALNRVKKLKGVELNAATLLSKEKVLGSELKNPQISRLPYMTLRLIPSTLCMLFTVSLMISLKDSMTAAGVIEALLKLSTLPIIGLKGYSGGYEYVKESEIAWLDTKSRLLESFISEYKENIVA